MTDIVVPDSIEPYVGYKTLEVKLKLLVTAEAGAEFGPPREIEFPVEPYLASPTYDFCWPRRRPAIAQCHHPHTPGQKGCSCGFYVVERPEGMFGYIGDNHVVVKMALWGQVTLGGRGARGQYAYPQEIVGWSVPDETAEQIAEIYGIPINKERGMDRWIRHSQSFLELQNRTLRRIQTPPATPVKRMSGKRMGGELAALFAATLVGSLALQSLLGTVASFSWWVACIAGWTLYNTKR